MFPSRSDLRGVNLAGEDLTGIRLVEADLAEAELSGADLSVPNLMGAHMGGARLVGATLVEANLEAVVAARTDFTLAAAMRCHCVDADFTDAVLRQSSWLDANWNAADLDGADLTACVIAGGSGFPEELLHSGAMAATRLVLTSGHAGPVRDVAWEPNGRLLASAGDDGSVYLWNLASKHELACFRGHAGPVNALAWISPEQLISGGSDGGLRAWDPRTGVGAGPWQVEWPGPMPVVMGTNGVQALAADGSGRLAAGGGGGQVQVWRLVALQQATAGPAPTAESAYPRRLAPINALAWSPGGRLAIATMTKNVIVWKPLASTAPLVLGEHAYWVTDVAFRDEKTLASSGLDNMVRLWNLNSGRETLSFMLPAEANSLAWGPGGVLALGCNDLAVRLWEPDSGRLGMAIADHPDRVWAVAWSNGGQLASADLEGSLRIWSAGGERRTLPGLPRALHTVAWGPANAVAAGGGPMACLASGTRAPATT